MIILVHQDEQIKFCPLTGQPISAVPTTTIVLHDGRNVVQLGKCNIQINNQNDIN